MKTRKQTEVIRLESLPAAAACLAVCDCKLIEVNRLNSGRAEFVLEGHDLEVTAADFLLGRLEGNLLNFMRHFDDLRTVIHNHRRATGRTGGAI